MEGIESTSSFSTLLSSEELRSIPAKVLKKIEKYTTDKFDELFRYKALLATTKSNTGIFSIQKNEYVAS